MPPLPARDLDQICEQTAPLWEEARGSDIFLTGGTGFFGCWLVESFLHANQRLALNARLTVLTRSPESFLLKCPYLASVPGLKLVTGDIRAFAVPGGEFPFVIHAATEAASTRLAAEQPIELLSTIVDGTRHTLDFAVAHGAKKFLLTSSGAVYGKQPPDITHVPETYTGRPDPLNPASAYGEGKVMAEHLCALYAKVYGLDCKIARCWAFTGAYLPLDQHFAIGNFIRDAMAGVAIRIGGDGTPSRSYLYASDLAVWLWTILFRGPALQPFNVGSGEAVTIRELADSVAHALRPGTRIEVAQSAIPGAPQSRYVPDVTLAERLLGLKVTVPLADAIRKTAHWYGFTTPDQSHARGYT
jgi:nucleoside-diphosphate-sugar epimerase